MDFHALRDYCLAKPGSVETFPFDDGLPVFKVGSKLFAILPPSTPVTISLKCDPIRAESLREQYSEITAGYHLNKKHWNTIDCTGGVPNELIKELIDHSYDLVVKSLKRSERETISKL